MAIDLYASCPCGSGKKFKWCCQPIHAEIERAFQQEAQGQHELALRLMDEIIQGHPDNPEAYGRKAQLLYQNERADDAEAALQKAFELNPKYPFGHLLKGIFRFQEGEVPGALILFRKAADYYDPHAFDLIAQAHEYIADCELKMNRPVAARAALQIALASNPNEQELRGHFDNLFGEKGRLPLSARKEYAFRPPVPASAAAGARLSLSEAVRLFDEQTKAEPESAAAWFNLGLAKAWLGDNAGALDALDRHVSLEADEAKAGEAWALGEVMRHGAGLEAQADHLDTSALYQMRDGRPVSAVLQEWEAAGRLIILQSDPEQNTMQGIVLDAPPVFSAAAGPADAAPLGAYLLVVQGLVRLMGPVRDRFDRVRAEFEQKAGAGLSPGQERIVPASFADAVSEAVLFPVRIPDPAEAVRRVRVHAEQFFEGTWLQRPLKSLGGVAPLDAAGHAVLRKKLRGVVQFLEECAFGALAEYDFGRVRRKLGLADGAAPAGGVPADISALSAPELAALSAETLSDDQLEQAWQAAQRFDAHEVGRHFAKALTARPATKERPDHYPWYSYLVQRSVAEGDFDAALDVLNEGEKADCEHNEGRRRNDYELRRGQLHARRGDADAAHGVFDGLIQRDPDNMKTRAAAAEAMLTLKQGARALRFAEEGLAQARQKNDRDSEGHLMELAAAAKKMAG